MDDEDTIFIGGLFVGILLTTLIFVIILDISTKDSLNLDEEMGDTICEKITGEKSIASIEEFRGEKKFVCEIIEKPDEEINGIIIRNKGGGD